VEETRKRGRRRDRKVKRMAGGKARKNVTGGEGRIGKSEKKYGEGASAYKVSRLRGKRITAGRGRD